MATTFDALHATTAPEKCDTAPDSDTSAPHSLNGIFDRVAASRAYSQSLAAPLSDEDQTVQAMPDASPTKWHLAHTTWFYEAFILSEYLDGYDVFDPDFAYCFNSYYEQKGARQPRAARGLLTRPSVEGVRAYRAHVDDALMALRNRVERDPTLAASVLPLLELGINHEQQHQELLLTDILALFAANPLLPAYKPLPDMSARATTEPPSQPVSWVQHEGGLVDIGHDGRDFSYDNESPRHTVYLEPFAVADCLVTNAEWQDFIDDGGYRTAALWLADGWAAVQEQGWDAPGYWQRGDRYGAGGAHAMTLHGLLPVDADRPVCHVSFYEADAFARWAGARLPTEFEWEAVAMCGDPEPPLTPTNQPLKPLLPQPASLQHQTSRTPGRLRQTFSDVWQWTASAYLAYPRYQPPAGAVGEYNGKFMSNQFVLKGASALTSANHSRLTYRNFFYPGQRWQMTGLRLAQYSDKSAVRAGPAS